MATPVLRFRSIDAAPITVGEVTITPRSQALEVRLPFGALVWHRPTSVLVERDHVAERLGVVDVTLLAQAAIVCLAAAVLVVLRRRAIR
jgi:hypothetical protein